MGIVKRFKNTAKSSVDLVHDVKEKGLKDATKDTLKENVRDISIGKTALGVMTGGLSFAFTGVKKKGTTKGEKAEIAAREKYLNDLTIDQCIIHDPKIKMDQDEICYYKGDATCLHSHVGVTGYSGGGTSVKLTKNIRVGGIGKKAQRGTIIDEYPGTFYITNKRLLLTASKHGFNIKLKDVVSVRCEDGHFQIYKNTTCHEFLTDDMDLILRIIELMGENAKRQLEMEEKEENNDPYEEIKKLKELLDMGIISNEEFETKKKELLGL